MKTWINIDRNHDEIGYATGQTRQEATETARTIVGEGFYLKLLR
jgi:hypothetical protein